MDAVLNALNDHDARMWAVTTFALWLAYRHAGHPARTRQERPAGGPAVVCVSPTWLDAWRRDVVVRWAVRAVVVAVAAALTLLAAAGAIAGWDAMGQG